MGATLDNVDGGDGPTVDAELKIGDFFFDEGKKSIIYKKSETETLDLGEPNDKKIYANAITKRLYIWRGGTWRQCGTNAYTKAESDSRYYEKQATDTLLAGKVSKTDIVQSTGTSTTAVMSQKAVSDAINKLKNAGYLYVGIATPTTNPGTPDGPVFYIASQAGTYSNFGNTEIDNTGIFTWDGTSWSFEKLDFGGGSNIEIINDLTTGGEGNALSAEMGKVLNEKIDLLVPNKNLNKRLFGTIGKGTGIFEKYIDIPRNLFNKYLYFWFTSGDYEIINGWNGGVTNGVVTVINNGGFGRMFKLWDGNDRYRIQRIDLTDFDGYDYIRISLNQKDDAFINALFIGSDLDADYLSWEFTKLRQIPPVTSNWYSGDNKEIKAVIGTRVRPSSVDYTRISTKNLFNPYEIVFATMTVGAPYYPLYESGFIPVEENTLYTVSLKEQESTVDVRFYNANKEQIGSTLYARHTTPANCAYVKFGLTKYHSGLGNLEPDAGVQYEKGEKTYYEPYYLFDAKGMVSALAGKSFAFIGDSFTVPGTWCAKMCEILSATLSRNAAISGGRWSGDNIYSAYFRAQELVTYYNTITSHQTTAPVKPDYILCVLGVNDVNNNITIGDVSYTDTIDTGGIDPSTFTGGVQATLKTLIDNFPNSIIKIGFTPGGMQFLAATGADMEKISSYIERLKFLANLYGVSYIETRATGMCRIVASAYNAYTVSAGDPHPNAAGQQRIGEYMARILLSNL